MRDDRLVAILIFCKLYSGILHVFLPPANEVWGKVIFYTSLSFCSQGGVACVVARGGRHAWLLGGACMVALGGVMCGCSGGVCVVALGGMHGCSGGHAWLLRGHAWLLGGCAWLLQGGHAWLLWGGMHGFFSFFGYNEIRSMSGRYASYWNAFLFYINSDKCDCCSISCSDHLWLSNTHGLILTQSI